MLLLRNVCERA